MKTVRANTFETNSSSSHSVSLSTPKQYWRDLTFVPNLEDLVVTVGGSISEEDADPISKIRFVIKLFSLLGYDTKPFCNAVKEFSGRGIQIEFGQFFESVPKFKGTEDEIEEQRDEWVDDALYSYRSPYDSDIPKVLKFAEKMKDDVELALDFVFSSNAGFYCEYYYDG